MSPHQFQELKSAFSLIYDNPDRREGLLANLRVEDPALYRSLIALLEGVENEPEEFGARYVGEYRIERELGSGGSGRVFLGVRREGDAELHVAIKVLREAQLPHTGSYFERERTILASLTHPNVARLLDWGVLGDAIPYLVMELVDGEPITDYCESRNLDIHSRLNIFLQLCSAVHYAHQHLIVHRDLKPANVLVDFDGKVKLLDFGIAKALEPCMDRTATGFRRFTPISASPEQVTNRPVTTASDVYALGVLLYQLITNRLPYRVSPDDENAYLTAIIDEEPILPSQASGLAHGTRKLLRGDLDRIVLKSLQKDPSRRYTSAEQMADDLTRWMRGFPVRARRDTWIYRTRKYAQRHKTALSVGMLAATLLMGATSLSLYAARIATQQRILAEQRANELQAISHMIVFDVNDQLRFLPGAAKPRRMLTEMAVRYLGTLAAQAETKARRLELASGLIIVGQSHGQPLTTNNGNYAGAVLEYQKARRIIEAEWMQHPHDVRVGELLLKVYTSIGDINPDPAVGSEVLSGAALVGEQLLLSYPSDESLIRQLQEVYEKIQLRCRLSGDFYRVYTSAVRERELCKAVIAIKGTAMLETWNIGVSWDNQAQAEKAMGIPSYLDSARKAIAAHLQAKTLAGNPEGFDREINLARMHYAPMLAASGRAREAVEMADSFVSGMTSLSRKDPENVERRYDAGTSYAYRGTVYSSLHRLSLARKDFREVRRILAPIASAGNTGALKTLLRSLVDLARVEQDVRQRRKTLAEAEVLAEEYLLVAPGAMVTHLALARIFYQLAECDLHEGDMARARINLARSKSEWAEVQRRSPEYLEVKPEWQKVDRDISRLQ